MSAAETGHIAVARQTLVGGNYALVDQNHDWRANPDFFIARLWGAVFEAGADAAGDVRVLRAGRDPVIATDAMRELRALGACGANGTLVLALANVAAEPVNVLVDFDGASVDGQGVREEWVLTGSAGDATSRAVELNGEPLAATEGAVPPLDPAVVRDGGSMFQAPAWSVSFVRFPAVFPTACAA